MPVSRFLAQLIAATALSACMGTNEAQRAGEAGLFSAFVTPGVNGFNSSPIPGEPIVITRSDDTKTGFSISAGRGDEVGIETRAGLLPRSDVSFRPSTGSGRYAGRYDVIMFDDVTRSNNLISGSPSSISGPITLQADFATGAVTGSSGELTINGQLDRRDMTGSVTFRGLRGPLRGLVGGDKAVGAFHGADRDLSYSGGILATRN